jgi:hypothetical protein
MLKLDEQSFQDMLAAAFTIQEHNAKRKRALVPEHVCRQCGASVQEGELLCGRCAGAEPRPGEQLQRKWASLWMMSQEQGSWPEYSSPEHSSEEQAEGPEAQDETVTAEIQAHHITDPSDVPERAQETDGPDDFPEVTEISEPIQQDVADQMEYESPSAALANVRPATSSGLLIPDFDSLLPESGDDETPAPPWSLRDLRLKLRFHRADLYLVVAIVISTFAMIWVLSATPAVGAQRKPRLRAWERALVSLGLADAPEPTARQGNPNIQVWVDPKTALYYCVGEELYGKAPGGHATTQGEAQMDQFEPAGRAACE